MFLDSDTIVLQNLDEIFQLDGNPEFAAVQTCICNPAKNPSYPSYWIPSNCPHTVEGSSTNKEECRMFNSGVFLFHPNKEVFQEMLNCLNQWDLNQFPFADQCFLNKFYRNKWKSLPSIYNSLKTFSLTHPNLWDTSKIKIIHYILVKPWETTDSSNQIYEKVNELWWNAYQYKAD